MSEQSGFTDDVDAARSTALEWVESVSTNKGWYSDETEAANEDIESAYQAGGWFDAFTSADVGESVGEQQVEAFWKELYRLSESWTGFDADKLRASIATAAGLAASDAGGDPTPADYFQDAADVVTESAQDLRDAADKATSPGVLIAAAVIAVAVAVALSSRK